MDSNFKPIELNERNVKALFKRCLPDEIESKNSDSLIFSQVLSPEYCGKSSEKVFLSKQKTKEYRASILYLLGQLKPLNLNRPAFALQEGFLRYDDTFWTKDYDILFKLYSLGLASACLAPFVSTKDLITTAKSSDCIPTLSPRDSNFQEWFNGYEAKIKKKTLNGQEPADD